MKYKAILLERNGMKAASLTGFVGFGRAMEVAASGSPGAAIRIIDENLGTSWEGTSGVASVICSEVLSWREQ